MTNQRNKTVAVKGTYCLLEAMIQHIQPWIESTDYEDLTVNLQVEGQKYDDVGMVLDDGNDLLRYIMYAGTTLSDKEKKFTEVAPKGMKERLPIEAIQKHIRKFDLPPALKQAVEEIIPTICAETEHGPTANTFKVAHDPNTITLFIFCRSHPVMKITIFLTELVNYVKLLEANSITADTAHKHVSETLSPAFK